MGDAGNGRQSEIRDVAIRARFSLCRICRIARACAGFKVKEPEQIAPAWETALSADRPVVYEAITDPEVPTLPPHISFKQATNFMRSMVKGDPSRGHDERCIQGCLG